MVMTGRGAVVVSPTVTIPGGVWLCAVSAAVRMSREAARTACVTRVVAFFIVLEV